MEPLDVFNADDLRERSQELLRDAREGRLSVVTEEGIAKRREIEVVLKNDSGDFQIAGSPDQIECIKRILQPASDWTTGTPIEVELLTKDEAPCLRVTNLDACAEDIETVFSAACEGPTQRYTRRVIPGTDGQARTTVELIFASST